MVTIYIFFIRVSVMNYNHCRHFLLQFVNLELFKTEGIWCDGDYTSVLKKMFLLTATIRYEG